MYILDLFMLAIHSLRASKMRTFLTMLGIIIGIGSVITIVTVGNSLTGSISDSMSSFGANSITVSLTKKSSSNSDGNIRLFFESSPDENDLISTSMIDEYREAYGQYIKSITFTESLSASSASSDGNTSNVRISGVNEEIVSANSIEMKTGRFIKDSDGQRKICVIADAMAEELFGTSDPIGKTISVAVDNQVFDFYVVGLYEYSEDGSVSFDGTTTYSVYIPLDTAKKINDSSEGFQSFIVSASTEVSTSELLNATEEFFQSFYTHNNSYTVEASSMETMVETMTEMMNTVSLAIAAIAAISLLVGGIGVMNIMLVSITERTREIGTRIALGATRNAIRLQFIVEAMVICLIGGCIGVVSGIGLSAVACNVLGYSIKPSFEVIALAVLFSLTIGIFFGCYPANKAAKMNPIDALRYE